MTHSPYSKYIKNKVSTLRKKGYSIRQIASKMNIAQSTISLWVRNIILNKKAQTNINLRKLIGKQKVIQYFSNKKKKEYKILNSLIDKYLENLHLQSKVYPLLCAFLYWAEGNKNLSNIAFINSDPLMIKVFLTLFRLSFQVDETKFRGLVHIHKYHNDNEVKLFWSKISNIPLSQFSKSYLKANSGTNIRKDYKGCFRIRYYDVKIAKYLTLLYKTFAEKSL